MPELRRMTLAVIFFAALAVSNIQVSQAGIVANGGSIDLGGGSLDLGCTSLVIADGATVLMQAASITAAGLIDNAGTLAAGQGLIELSGEWINSGQFVSGTSTVSISDECNSQTGILGETAFWNLQADGLGGQLNFESGALQTIANALVLTGLDASTRLSIGSTSAGMPGFLELSQAGTQNIQFVDVRDSHVLETGQLLAPGDPADYGSVDSGGNRGWFLGALDAAIPVPGLTWFGVLLLTLALLMIAGTRHASLPRTRS